MKAGRIFWIILCAAGLAMGAWTLSAPSPAYAATCTWTGAVSTDWGDFNNWSGCPAGSIPGVADTAIIPNVTNDPLVSIDATVDALTIQSGGVLTVDSDYTVAVNTTFDLQGTLTGSGDLTVTGSMIWTGPSTQSGTGRTTIAAGASLEISGSYNRNLDGRRLDNYGSAVWNTSYGIVGSNGAVFNNQPGASFDAQANSSFSGGVNASFNNFGTLVKSAGTGATAIDVLFTNSGTLRVESGMVSLREDGSHSGDFIAAAGGTLDFYQSTHTLQASSTVSGGGIVQFSSGSTVTVSGTYNVTGTTEVSGGTVDFNSAASTTASLALSYGTLTGSGDLTVTGSMIWTSSATGCTQSGAGTTTIAAAASLEISGSFQKTLDGRRMDNYGSAVWSGSYDIVGSNGAVFNNQPGASFDAQGDASFSGDANASFNNLGTLVKSAGTGATVIDVLFTNSGTLRVESGMVRLGEGGSHSGDFIAAAGGTLDFYQSTHTLQASSTVSGGGIVQFSSGSTVTINGAYNVTGTTEVSGGTVNFNSAASTTASLALSYGTLTGSGDLTVTGSMIWTSSATGSTQSGAGTTTIAAAASLEISGSFNKNLDGRRLDNYGSAVWSGSYGIAGSNGAVFNNQAGASFDAQASSSFSGGVNASFNNFGTLVKSAGTGATVIDVLFTNTGTLRVESGMVRLGEDGSHSGDFIAAAGGTLDFYQSTHTLQASSTVSGGGIVQFSSGSTVTISGTYNVTGTTQVSGGTVNFNPAATATSIGGTLTISGGTGNFNSGEALSVTTLTQSSGTLNGSDNLTVTGSMTWTSSATGSTQSGAGTTTIAAGASLEISGSYNRNLDGRRLDNYGSAVWNTSYGIVGSNGAVFNNQPGASFDAQANSSFSGGVNASFNNFGTLVKSAGTGATVIDALFTNAGTLRVETGMVSLREDGSHSGDFIAAAGGTLDFYQSTHTLQASSTVSGEGSVRFNSGSTVTVSGTYNVTGTTQVIGASADFGSASSVACGDLIQSGGVLSVDNTITISGDFTRSGGTFTAGSGTLIFNGAAVQTLTLNTATTFHNLTVLAGTTLVEAVAADNASVGGILTNLGVIRKARSVGTGAATFGLTGIAMDIATLGTLTTVQVDRIDTHHPNATGTPGGSGTMTGKYWTIIPTGADYTLTLTLPHNQLTDPSACRYTGSGNIWDCSRTSFTAGTVSRQGVTTLSDWAVGDKVGPTAVELIWFSASSESDRLSNPGVIVFVVLGIIAVVALSLTGWRVKSL